MTPLESKIWGSLSQISSVGLNPFPAGKVSPEQVGDIAGG